MRRILLLLCALCALLPATAMMVAVSDQELVATSDLVIVGTVKEAVRLPNVSYVYAGQAVVTVTRVLRGPKLETVTVRHAMPPEMRGGMVVMDHGGFELTPGQQQLFFLTRTRDGYTITGGFQGMKPIGDADRFAGMLEKPSVEVTFAQAMKPIFFGQPQEVKFTVKNNTATPLNIHQPRLTGYYYSPLLEANFAINPVPANADGMLKAPTVPCVEPGGEVTITQTFRYERPAAWLMLAPETYLLTPAALRATVFVQSTAPPLVGYPVTSPWQTVLIGYPPPPEARK
jgi:hypothetical protein